LPENSDETLFTVPSPSDDTTDTTRISIQKMISQNEPQLIELANSCGYNLHSPDGYLRVIRDCWQQTVFQARLKKFAGAQLDEQGTSFEDCLRLMESIGTTNPLEKLKIMTLQYDLGMRYRRIWISESR
jgi:hypothetical protein